MPQTTLVLDKQVFQGTAAIAGTFVVTLPTAAAPYTDKGITIRAWGISSHATAGHQDQTAKLEAEASVQNANNVCSFPTALLATNPINSNSAGGGFHVQAVSLNVNLSTLIITINGSNQIVLTWTNNAAAGNVAVNVTIYVEIEYVGST